VVEHAIEPEHDGHALAGAHGGEDGSELAGQQVSQVEQLFDDFSGGESARGRDAAVVAAYVLPHGPDLPTQGADHLGKDLDDQAELPLDRRTRYRGCGSDAVSEPIQPLGDHFVTRFSDHTTSGEQRGLRSAHCRAPGCRDSERIHPRAHGVKAMNLPRMLVRGARIALVAPAGPLLERDDLLRAEELVRAIGCEPLLGRHAAAHHGYLAGTDAERAEDLNAALRSPEIDAVWCIRGGYGITRILDQVDVAAFAAHPKPVIGFSDITALLVALQRETGIPTFHGPIARHGLTTFSRTHFERVLMRAEPAGLLDRLPQEESTLVPRERRIVALADGTAEGPLVGGNLSLIQCLLGTRFMPDLRGGILFLEDVGEEVYRIDRMLSHLRLAGALDGVAGVAVGQFTETHRRGADGAMGLDRVLAHYLEPLGVPVAMGFPIGHLDDQWTMPIGIRARLDAGAGQLELLEPAVRAQ
jgi:muramoyltetrapeptide carboxypeptidase